MGEPLAIWFLKSGSEATAFGVAVVLDFAPQGKLFERSENMACF
jgi:hypothetical protein